MPVDPRIPAFKRYDILLAIDGDRNNVALKRGVLAPEVKLLQALHARFGDSDAGNPVELAPGDDGLPAVEEARIAPDKAYAYLTGVYGAPLVEKLFGPKLNRNLPFELDVDDYELAFAQAAKDDAAALAADPDPLEGRTPWRLDPMWTLSGMLDALRAELRQSLQPFAHGPDALALEMQALRAAQSELCLMHEWPGLRVWADVELNPGQRVYDWPSAATGRPGDHPARIDAAEIRRAVLYDPPSWLDIARGIDPLLYDFHDGDKAERCPCQGGLDARPARWDVWGESGFHIWPVAGKRCQRLRFIVQKQPRPLINMEDEPSLDGHLIVLTAAARCATDDKRRLQLSQRAAEYFSRLKGRCGNAEGWSNLTGGLLAYRRGPQPFAARAMGWRTGA